LFVFVHVCLFVFLVPVVEPGAEAGAVTLKAMKENAGRYESGCVQDVHVVVVVVVAAVVVVVSLETMGERPSRYACAHTRAKGVILKRGDNWAERSTSLVLHVKQ
jgi:hypothetical protein